MATTTENKIPWYQKEITFGKLLGNTAKERLFSQMAILLETGIDIATTLEFCIEDQKSAKVRALLIELKQRVIEGATLSKALQSLEEFSPYEYYSVQIGEEAGTLVQVLQELAEHYQKRIEQNRQLVNTMSYPVIVLSVSFMVMIFMMKFLVPMFSDMFLKTGGELPWITQVVVDFSDGFSAALPYMVGGIILSTAGVLYFKNHPLFRKNFALFMLILPFVGKLYKKNYLARYFQSLSLLVKAKVPLLNGIELVEQMIQFYPLEQACQKLAKDLIKGKTFHSSLSEINFFSKQEVALVRIGEEVNELDLIFDKISKQHASEVEHQSKLLGTIMEPLLIIFMAVMVAVIVIAMYLPMFEVSAGV